jgi:hypothetical protein
MLSENKDITVLFDLRTTNVRIFVLIVDNFVQYKNEYYGALDCTPGLGHFFVSCERLLHSELRNVPLIVCGNSDRAVIASYSYDVRKFGVRFALLMKLAKRLCPRC